MEEIKELINSKIMSINERIKEIEKDIIDRRVSREDASYILCKFRGKIEGLELALLYIKEQENC